MFFIFRNIATIHIAIFVGAMAWVYGGMHADGFSSSVPWLWVLVMEAMLCFPQRREGESTSHARYRVWQAIKADPIVWVSIALIVILSIPFVNTALCPQCDHAAIMRGAEQAAPAPFLPFCANRMHHLSSYTWFVAALTVLVGVKHSLLKSGKRVLMELLVWNGVLLAVLGFVQQVSGAMAPFWGEPSPNKSYFFSVFGYSNRGGDYFTSLCILSLALWFRKLDEEHKKHREEKRPDRRSSHKQFWAMHYMLIASVLLFFAAIDTLSRSAILIVSVSAGFLFVLSGLKYLFRLKKVKRVKAIAWMALGLVILSVIVSVFSPEKLRKEVAGLSTLEVADRLTGRNEYHSNVAIDLFLEHPLFGCGGWGYRHFSVDKTPKNVVQQFKYDWSTGGANVHNDYLQFLVEHGAIVVIGLIAIVVMVLYPVGKVWSSLARSARFSKDNHYPPPQGFFVFPLSAFAIILSLLGTLIHALGDCPFRSASVLTLFFAQLAAIDGFLPRLVEKKEEEDASR